MKRGIFESLIDDDLKPKYKDCVFWSLGCPCDGCSPDSVCKNW